MVNYQELYFSALKKIQELRDKVSEQDNYIALQEALIEDLSVTQKGETSSRDNYVQTKSAIDIVKAMHDKPIILASQELVGKAQEAIIVSKTEYDNQRTQLFIRDILDTIAEDERDTFTKHDVAEILNTTLTPIIKN